MPNPAFEPIIGRDFGDIGAQRFAWAGFNRGVEAENLARLAAAEAVRNNWLREMSDLQRNEALGQATLEERARDRALQLGLSRESTALDLGLRREDAARQEKQFAQDLAFRREALAAQGEQAGQKLDLMKAQQEAAIEEAGRHFAENFGLAKKAADTTEAALEDIQQRFEEHKAAVAKITAQKKPSPEDTAFLTDAPAVETDLKRQLRAAQTAANRAGAAYERIQQQMAASNFNPIEEQGIIRHRLTGKEWNFSQAVKEAVGNAPGALTPAPVATTSEPEVPLAPTTSALFEKKPGWSPFFGQQPTYPTSFGGPEPIFTGTEVSPNPIPAPAPAPEPVKIPNARWKRDASGKLVLVTQ